MTPGKGIGHRQLQSPRLGPFPQPPAVQVRDVQTQQCRWGLGERHPAQSCPALGLSPPRCRLGPPGPVGKTAFPPWAPSTAERARSRESEQLGLWKWVSCAGASTEHLSLKRSSHWLTWAQACMGATGSRGLKERFHPAFIGIQVRDWADRPEANPAISLSQAEPLGEARSLVPLWQRVQRWCDPTLSSLQQPLWPHPTPSSPSSSSCGRLLGTSFVYSRLMQVPAESSHVPHWLLRQSQGHIR